MSDQNPQVVALSRRLELLGQISDDALASVAHDVELRIENLAGTTSIDPVQLKINAGAGVNNQRFAEQQAIKRAAEKTVATIDKESLQILRILHGEDVVKLARAWKDIKALNTKAAR
jgi:predicted component of type VI protein secretion system